MNIISLYQINHLKNDLFKKKKFDLVILFKTDIKYSFFLNEVNYANHTNMITMQVDFVWFL